ARRCSTAFPLFGRENADCNRFLFAKTAYSGANLRDQGVRKCDTVFPI
ncbi:hypothetical protein, partial [Salmonella enterica subsp. enterica serovar Enteritidis]